MIYIIGDSHVSIFSGVDTMENGNMHMQPEFGTCYTLSQGKLREIINPFEKKLANFLAIKVGSYTAYNSFNKLSKIEHAITEYNIGVNDYIFICFGQIDIQNHLIPNTLKNNLNIIQTIEICVDRYIKTLNYLKEKYPNIKIGAYGAPSTSIGCGNRPKISKDESIEYNKITLLFNDYLKIKCEENSILFKEISKKLLQPDGSTNNIFVIDDIHLSVNTIPFILDEFSDITNNLWIE
jgi:hypothetical protein